MMHNIPIFATCLLIFFISSCSPAIENNPTQQATVIPTASYTPTSIYTPTPTYTPTPITFEFMLVENQVKEFLDANGGVDTSPLNPEQRKDFSSALVKELNARRGANPTTYKGEAYLDYESFRMKNLTDGSTPEQQTFPLFLPVTVDDDGHLKVEVRDGIWTTVAGSRDVDWNMVIESTDDPRIDWPLPMPPEASKDFHCGGMFLLDPHLDLKKRIAEIPVVLLDKRVGQIYLEGSLPHRNVWWGFLRFLSIITDPAGNPVAARNSIASYLNFCLMEEGRNSDFSKSFMNNPELLELYLTNPDNKDLIAMWKALEINQVYYLGIAMDQEYTIQVNSKIDNWVGLAPLNDIYPILIGEKENNLDLVLVQSVNWIKAKK